MSEQNFNSLSKVCDRIHSRLAPAIAAGPFWVQAEINSPRVYGGTLYCELVEMRAGKVVAKMQCRIWSRDMDKISRKFRSQGLELELKQGTSVGVLCQVDYHPVYGLSLVVRDMSLEWALGDLERRKREILEKLENEDLLKKNKAVSIPALPSRIGLVASGDTAGYQDFVMTLTSSAFGFHILHADARVQGENVETTVLEALDCLARLNVDLIVIIRGGGSKFDLSFLDNEAIARRIASLEVPVWTGIGHEIDFSVLDAVAGRYFKTPTDVAKGLVERFAKVEALVLDAKRHLKTSFDLRLGPVHERLQHAQKTIAQGARASLVHTRLSLTSDARLFKERVSAKLLDARADLKTAGSQLTTRPKIRVEFAGKDLEVFKKSLTKTTGRLMSDVQEKRRRLKYQLKSPIILKTIQNQQDQQKSWSRLLKTADPQKILDRGFSLTLDQDGKLIRNTKQVKTGDTIKTKLSGGILESTVEKIEE